MAYAIFWNEELFRIAENDIQKDNLNISYDIYNLQTITSEQFNKLKKERATASFNNNTVVVTDLTYKQTFNQEKAEHDKTRVMQQINLFLDNNNSSHAMYNICQNYKQVLESFDYSTIVENEDKTWGEYCDENSIEYLNVRQIP